MDTPAQKADKILHSHNKDAIAGILDEPGTNTLEVLKQLQKQSSNLGDKNLPQLVIEGLGEHLVHEAKQGTDISNEYNQLNGTEKRLVADDMASQRARGVHIMEDRKGELQSVDADLENGTSRNVYQKSGTFDKIKKGAEKVHVHVDR